jgi:hypothetical protein
MNTNQPDVLYFAITSHREVHELASQIASRDRGYPVITLTARPGERKPALSVKRIREIVGPDTPIYFLRSYDLALRLSHLLPRLMTFSGGAGRLWWPGVDKDSRPEDHPKFIALRGDAEDMVYEWLEGEFHPAPALPLTLEEVPPLVHVIRCHRRLRGGRRVGITLISGMKLLAHFDDKRAVGHGELANSAGLSRPVAHRCLVELAWLGYLVETRERRFRLAGGRQRGELVELAIN